MSINSHTCDDISYTDIDPVSIRVVRRMKHEIQWHDIHFTEGSTFEDVRRAEQILAGPSVKVSIPFDRCGSAIESRNIEPGDTVVLHLSDVGNSVFVDLCKDDQCRRIFGSKGDRLFQFFRIQPHEIIEDEVGYQMQMDFPVVHPIKIVLVKKDFDITPTLKYDVEDEQTDHPFKQIVDHAAMELRDKVQMMQGWVQFNVDFALDRWKTLRTYSQWMGDDEMAFMLGWIERKSEIPYAGIYQWHQDEGFTRKDGGSTFEDVPRSGSRVGAIIIEEHWIPFVASHGYDLCSVTDYANTTKISNKILKQLCHQIFGHERVVGHWCELGVSEGWCGFAAVDWLLGKLALPVPALSQDEIQPRILQIQEIGRACVVG